MPGVAANNPLTGGLNRFLNPPTGTSQVGYGPGQNTPNLPPGSQAATDAAQAAVQGINSSVGSGGGPGSQYTVDPNGHTSYSVTPNLLPQQAAVDTAARAQAGDIAMNAQTEAEKAAQAAEANKEGLSEKAFQARLAALGSTGAFNTAPQVTGGGPSGQLSPEETAARAAAFARAKDQAGMTANSALEGLRSATNARGIAGSSIEGEGMARILGGGAGEINDYTGAQLASDLGRSSQVSDRNYQGNITQRGQDLQARQALLALVNSGSLY